MLVYVEFVVLDNLVIDYILLKTTFIIVKTLYSKCRIFLSAVLGSGVALLIPLINHLQVLTMAVKILTGFLLMLVAKNYNTIKEYFLYSCVFFLLTFALGGGILAVFTFIGLQSLSQGSIGITAILGLLLISFIKRVMTFCKRKQIVSRHTLECELTLGATSVKALGFIDTGNGVYNGDSPVIFCNRKLSLKLLANKIKLPSIGYITVSTACGQDKLMCFKLDQLKIYIGDKTNIHNNVMLSVARQGVGVGYDVLLHPDLIGESYDECDCKIKKVS